MIEKKNLYLGNSYFFDLDNPNLQRYAKETVKSATNDIDKAIALYNRIRDQFRYDAFHIRFTQEDMRASSVIQREHGFCIDKALLLAACARILEIPARLGFADVKNHLASEKFSKLMGSNIFTYHGYTELFLNGHWVKATPAFNKELCDKFNVAALEFDGKHDSVFQEFDKVGRKNMEYIRQRGIFADLPFDEIVNAMKIDHPLFYDYLQNQGGFA
jgi:transglutaminase-like putative cysteine protease